MKPVYKIHALSTVQNREYQRTNGVFYDDYEQALNKASHYAAESHEPMVIFRAVVEVHPKAPEVDVYDID